jgi:two-component system, NarL family, sensor kinase
MRNLIITKLSLLAFCCLIGAGASAGQATTDSLINEFDKATTADTRVKLGFGIASRTIFSEPKIAAKYLLTSIKDSSAVTEKFWLGKCYNALCIYYMQINHDSGLYYIDKAIRVFADNGDTAEVYNAKKNKGLTFNNKGDYRSAVGLYLEVLAYFKKAKDTSKIVAALNDVGNAYLNLKNLEAGLSFQREALSYLAVFNHPTTLGNVLNSLGHIHGEMGRKDSAIYYYTQSLKIKEKYGSLQTILNTRNNLCFCIDYKTQPQKSIACFEELLPLQQRAEDHPGIIRSYINLAIAYRFAGNNSKAMEYGLLAQRRAEEIGDKGLLVEVHKTLASNYEQVGQYKQAYDALKQEVFYKDSVYSSERSKETVEMAARYELEKKDHRISEQQRLLLNTQNEKLKAELEVKEKESLVQALLLIGGIGVITVVFLIYRNKAKQEREKMEAILAERHKGLNAIIDAQEEERTRIAKELHDGVGNQLLALQMSISARNASEAQKAGVNDLLKGIMDEVRTVSHQMMPRILQEFGCVPALEDMLAKTFGVAGTKYSFETHQVEGKRYDPRLETAVYRIAQELVNNIIKHAEATEVSVQLIETGNMLRLLVEDNGKGMNTDSKKEGLGLSSMKSRANAVNGEINISSTENVSTAVTLRIPLS